MSNEVRDRTRLIGFIIVPAVEDLRNDPLCPPVIVRIRSIHRPVPIEAQGQRFHLLFVALSVLCRRLARVNPRINGVLFSWQAKGVKAHWVQYIEALLPFAARHDVRSDVPQRVPYVQPCP